MRLLREHLAHELKMIWLGERRGYASDWTTQRWVQLTGKRISLGEHEWLGGPSGSPRGIGPRFFDELAVREGLELRRDARPRGLIADFTLLAAPDFDPLAVHPDVRAFYEETSRYETDVWSRWTGVFGPFGKFLALLFSRRLQQMNVPLSPLDTSLGIRSEVVLVTSADNGERLYAAWNRQLLGSGDVLYAAAYSHCEIPGREGPCVKVVFPLPNGNATVFMRPEAHPDGTFVLISSGRQFGDPGFYFTVQAGGDQVWARYLPSLRETIHAYPSEGGVRADHRMTLWGLQFLHLHYRLRRRD